MKVIQVVRKQIQLKICNLLKKYLGEPLLVHKRTATSSNSRPNTSTSATFDQVDQTSDGTSTDDNISSHNRLERSPVNKSKFFKIILLLFF